MCLCVLLVCAYAHSVHACEFDCLRVCASLIVCVCVLLQERVALKELEKEFIASRVALCPNLFSPARTLTIMDTCSTWQLRAPDFHQV
jgi:hypothetical protein